MKMASWTTWMRNQGHDFASYKKTSRHSILKATIQGWTLGHPALWTDGHYLGSPHKLRLVGFLWMYLKHLWEKSFSSTSITNTSISEPGLVLWKVFILVLKYFLVESHHRPEGVLDWKEVVGCQSWIFITLGKTHNTYFSWYFTSSIQKWNMSYFFLIISQRI